MKRSKVALLKVEETLEDGSLRAKPQAGRRGAGKDKPSVRIVLPADDLWRRALPPRGARFLARMRRVEDDALGEDNEKTYTAQIIRRLGLSDASKSTALFASVLKREEKSEGGRLFLAPTEKGKRRLLSVSDSQAKALNAQEGDLVLARRHRYEGKIEKRVGRADAPGAWGLIAMQEHGLQAAFPEEAEAEAERLARDFEKKEREDMTALPFITIDPQDARDHDDAVHAIADSDPGNRGGFKLYVAIADVAHYVLPDSAIDEEARRRGSSAYLADRVLPMLPERLSSDLCSLKEKEERPVLCAALTIGSDGALAGYVFSRAVVKVRKNWTYEDFEKTRETKTHEALWGVHSALEKARQKRQPLEITLPERNVVFKSAALNKQKTPKDSPLPFSIKETEFLAAHRLIENSMVAANVAASSALDALGAEALQRAHDAPANDKKAEFQSFLSSFGIKGDKKKKERGTSASTPSDFNKVLKKAKNPLEKEILSLAVLRAQAQAHYSRKSKGHFGLQCAFYAHFTSPIRRYADLVVHRALLDALSLQGKGGRVYDALFLDETARHISERERVHQSAEYDTLDRYSAALFTERLGENFDAHIVGISRSGLFVRIDAMGAEGFIPASSLSRHRLYFDPKKQTLSASRRGSAGMRFQLGQPLRVLLEEASPITGGMRFSLS